MLPLFARILCLVLILLFSALCPSSFLIILMGKSELVDLLKCLTDVLCQSVFLTAPWMCLWCVIVAFTDHTHLLFKERGTCICAHAWIFFELCILITHYI